jgi:hypothetical protein
MTITELWTPSDELLTTDPIASEQIEHPHETTGLEQAGLALPDIDDDAANAAAAAWALAEGAADGAYTDGQPGECADDDEVADADADAQDRIEDNV